MTGSSNSGHERPREVEYRAEQRAVLVLGFEEAGERQESRETGWARIDGHFVHFLNDVSDRWESWPAHAVLCVEWEPVSGAGETTQ